MTDDKMWPTIWWLGVVSAVQIAVSPWVLHMGVFIASGVLTVIAVQMWHR
jgi:hypothetical protein